MFGGFSTTQTKFDGRFNCIPVEVHHRPLGMTNWKNIASHFTFGGRFGESGNSSRNEFQLSEIYTL